MSWAGEPAPGAARQLRLAQRPSRTGVRGSREDLGRGPRRVGSRRPIRKPITAWAAEYVIIQRLRITCLGVR